MNRSGQSGSNESKGGASANPPSLDQAVAAIRAQPIPAQEADLSRRRVWQRLQEAQSAGDPAAAAQPVPAIVDPGIAISGCGDVRALLGAYRAGTLPPARQLLVQMHLRDCVGCREAHANRAMGRLRPWGDKAAPVAAARAPRSRLRWTLAAAAVFTLGVGGWLFGDAFQPTPDGPRATLDESQGPVQLLTASGQRVMAAGGSLMEREWVRTPRDSRATLRLRDGSRVELKPHTEVGVSMNRQDVKVHLERGSIIVHAAERRRGHLIVATEDARVVVTGTVFSVNRGTKGTRVSVLEGTVRVDVRGQQRVLTAGQQLSTSQFMNGVPIREEVAWSGQVQQHAALLGQAAPGADPAAAPATLTFGRDIRWPQLRYGSTLLPRLPADTLMFVAIPNYKDALDGAKVLIDKQLQDNAVLNPWWKDKAARTAPALGEVFRRVRALSEHLGDEIVLGMSPSADGREMHPVVLAEVKRPGLRALLEQELLALDAGDEIQLLDRAGLAAGGAPSAKPPEGVILVDDKLVALARSPGELTRILSGAEGLAGTAFGQRLSESYRDGAGLLFAVDLGAIAPRAAAGDAKGQQIMQQLGASDARYLVVEQEHLENSTQNRTTVSFAGPRTGVASWLAAPSPMGALDFVTPGASFAAAFVVKEPALVLDDLLRLIETLNPGMRLELAQLEARTGVQLRADLAATLGNDLVAAIDGPLLPLPSWKLVMEVQDPVRLAQSLERLVGELNRVTSAAGRPGLTWQRQETGSAVKSAALSASDTFILRAPGTPFVAHLLFVDGYLVVAPNDQMLHRAVRARQGGQVLRGSWRFQQLLPPDREANFSAVVYHNLGEAASAVAGWLGGSGALQSEQQQGLDRLVKDAKPGLFYVYGGSQEIQVASTGGFFGVTLDHVLGSAGLSDLLEQAAPGYHHPVSMAEAADEVSTLPAVVALDDLRVSLGGRPVLKGLTCQLRGRCIGLLGPNGAGKSTLINTLLGFHPLAGGTVRVFGRDLGTEPSEIRSAIGYMPESDSFIADMTGVAFVRYMAELAGLPARLALERTHEAFLYVGLGEARYRKVGTYSLGMKQMAKLAQAIVHGPRLLLLDEPTNGLDPPGRLRMLRLIREIRDTQGVHVLVSSHLLRDVEECCDEVLILKNGVLAASCNLAEERRAQRKFLELETTGTGFPEAVARLGCESASFGNGRMKLVLPERLTIQQLYAAAAEQGVQIRRFSYRRDSLEDIFLRAMEAPERAAGGPGEGVQHGGS